MAQVGPPRPYRPDADEDPLALALTLIGAVREV
jgi:hypothetical protein